MCSLVDNWKSHFPTFWHQQQIPDFSDTCTDNGANSEVPSKYSEGQSVWVKLDPNTKWMPGKIVQVLPKPELHCQCYQMDVNLGEMNTTLHSNDQVPNHQLCLNCLMNNLNPTTSDQGKIYKVSNGLISLPQVCKENLIAQWTETMISNDVSFINCSSVICIAFMFVFCEFDLNSNYWSSVNSICIIRMLYLSNKLTTLCFICMILF